MNYQPTLLVSHRIDSFAMKRNSHDADEGKGAVEQDKPGQPSDNSMQDQLPHRPENDMISGNDSDFPEPGENPEHSGEPEE
jgi:hypothetical protein